jgi:hypothetical protein
VGTEDATYEWLRSEVSSLPKAPLPSSRRLDWVTSEHSIAVSRDTEGRLEVFVPGEPLSATTRTVAEVLEHQVWKADDGTELAATRVVLPAGHHFDQFGALVCVELLANGLEQDPQVAFSAVEPLIALALTREMVTDLTLMGLIGELALLEALLAATPPDSASDVLRSWAGSAPSARDFQLGTVGVEVKTTQGASSIHHVEGVHQVELGHSNDNVAETALFLLSLGISWIADMDEGESLPELVDSILTRMPGIDGRVDLLARIKQYGGDAAVGYDHQRDREKVRYSTRFYFRFERLYDMCDDRLKLLSSAHLAGLANVDPGSVTFRVVLNDRIRGEHNPVTGWSALTSRILSEAGLPSL